MPRNPWRVFRTSQAVWVKEGPRLNRFSSGNAIQQALFGPEPDERLLSPGIRCVVLADSDGEGNLPVQVLDENAYRRGRILIGEVLPAALLPETKKPA